MTDHLAPPSTSASSQAVHSNNDLHDNSNTTGGVSDGHGPVRPIAPVGASTRRDIHISEQGQHTAPNGPTRIATWRPIPNKCKIKKEFTPDSKQSQLINELKEYTEKELILKPGDGELYQSYGKWERRFLDRPDTYSRYMRAADWKMDNAKKRIKETLEWRRKYQPDLIKPEEIRKEAEGGKVVVNGFDRDGRPIVWLRPSRENTKPTPTQIRHLIFQLERAIDLLPEGVEKLALVVDYKGATSSNNPSLKTVKEVIYILQNHYVERLGKGVVVNVPFYLNAFFSMIKPLLDPKTKSKVAFNPSLEKLIPKSQLDSEFIGGDYHYIYDSNVYLPALCHFCGIKEDGTREEVIPVKDLPSERPEEIQRSLTQKIGDTAEEDADYARKEAEAQERQDREAEEYARKVASGEISPDGKIDDDDDDADTTIASNTTNEPQDSNTATTATALGGAALAGTAGTAALAAHHPSSDQALDSKVEQSTSTAFTTKDNVLMRPKESTAQHETVSDANNTTTAATAAPKSDAVATPTTTSNNDTSAPPAAAAAAASPVVNNHAAPTPSSQETRQAGRRRGGWKLFSSKRGLDKEGNATLHKHKHISKALCMHKGAIDPSWATQQSSQATPSEKAATGSAGLVAGAGGAANGTTPTTTAPSDGRIKIAPEALEGREERTYTNAPLATNATFGPDAYHTAMEAYPTNAGNAEEGGDYFTDMRKIPPVKPAAVDDEHQDQAKLVSRPTEIMNRLHEGGTGDLVLAYEVKQPPVETNGDKAEEEGDVGGGSTTTTAKGNTGDTVTKAA